MTLVLPAWNEAESITCAIDEADLALQKLVNDGYVGDFEIIVVDDGSRDATASIVDELSHTHSSLRLVRHEKNTGYGAALRSGFAAATKELVVFTDADCQFDLKELDRLVMLSRQYDIVCGYRIDRKDSAIRCLYSRVYNIIAGSMLGTNVRDVDCAMKLFHRNVVQSLSITTNGFLVNSELLTQARQQNYSIVEVGVSHRPRTQGQSTVSATHIPSVLASLTRYWWNAVQFRGSSANPTSNETTSSDDPSWIHWAQIALVVIAFVFLFTNLNYPLIDRDETRYAEIPREMLVSNNWALPQLNFEPYYDKPPLMYWLCAMSYQMFGISEWSARIVPALAAFMTLLATLWFGSRVFGKTTGLLGAGVLMLSAGFVFTSRYLLIDGVLSCLVAFSLFAAYEAIRGEKVDMRWWMFASVCCGLACLAKGPLSMVLLLPPVFAFAWLSNGYAKPAWWHYAALVGTVFAITAPWLVAVSMQDPDFLVEFLYRHNLRRFAGEFHAKPMWYFIPVLLVAGHPWSFLTIPYLRFLFTRSDSTTTSRPPVIGFLMLWGGWCFTFFSLSSCKLPTYLLPAAPAFALMIGHYLQCVLYDLPRLNEHWFARFWSARTSTATTCFAGVGFVVYALCAGLEVTFSLYLWGLLWSALFVGSIVMLGDRHQGKFAWAPSAAATSLFAVMMMHQMLPIYSRSQTILGTGSPLNASLASITDQPFVTVSHEFSEIPFYLQRKDVVHLSDTGSGSLQGILETHGQAIVVLDRRISVETLRKDLPKDCVIKTGIERGPAILVYVSQDTTVPHIAARP